MNKLKFLITFFIIAGLFMAFTAPVSANQNSRAKSKLININYAGSKTLMKLPGIGEKKAERIILFRKKNGKFKRTRDIMKINGIGEKTFKKFARMITV